MVIWILGLSGSGKSFLAKNILKKIKKKKIWIDGDEVRRSLTYSLGYSIGDRKKNSLLISNLCKFLEDKGFIVVCSILSIFPEHQKKNRKIFKKYLQIYIKSEISELIKKNTNKVYQNNKNVVGKDLKFPKPYQSDYVINRNFIVKNNIIIQKIIKRIND